MMIQHVDVKKQKHYAIVHYLTQRESNWSLPGVPACAGQLDQPLRQASDIINRLAAGI
jgi:hypothetical protein